MSRRISEERTRKEMKAPLLFGGVDPQLERVGWYLRDHSKVKTEIPVDGYDKEPWNGISDYTLYGENGKVLAMVETKKTSTNSHIIQQNSNADQIRFSRAAQSVFLQKRHLETADLYDAPALFGFGQDTVERWFTEKEVKEVVKFANKLSVSNFQEGK
jgi:hypothetical protein